MFTHPWRRAVRALALGAVCGPALVACAWGAPLLPSAENYTTRVWQTRDGLPQETVQAVAQTPDGFLWIGTTGGLLRFDGSRFVSYNRSNTPAFHENSVFSLLTGSDGTLWIGTEGGGLVRMQNGAFRHFGAGDGVLDGFVRSVLEDRRGQIWIGTDDGLYRLHDRVALHAVRVDGTPSIPAVAVHALAETPDGTVWMGGSRLLALRDDVATAYPLVGEYSETRVKSILQTRDGVVWVGTVSGLQKLSPGIARFERFPAVQGTVRTLRETSDGTVWIGTIGSGAYTLREGRLAVVGAGEMGDVKLPSNTTLSLFEDAEKNIWMGTQAGLLRFSRSPVKLVPLPHASDSDFETISRDTDGSLWVAGTSLSHLVNGVATPTTFPALHGARVRNVFRAHDGTLWVGTDGRGLFHLGPHGAAEQFTVLNGLVNNFVRGILQTTNGDLWIATDEGVSRIAGGVIRNFGVRDGLVYFSVRTLLEDQGGDLWIGTDRGLSHLVQPHMEQAHFVEDEATRAVAGAKVWALDQTANGALWIGTRDDGLYRIVSTTAKPAHFTLDEGLASDSVFQILEDGKARFWISGENGVSVIAIADLDKLAADPHFELSKRFFAVSTGGELSPLYGGTMPAGAVAADGDIWFPSSKGPVRFLAAEAGPSAVPRVFLDQIVADGRTFSTESGRVDLSASSRNLEIAYGSILLGPQDAVQFQYKLDNFDREWRYGSNRRVADYTNLPAGTYTFRVRAFAGSGAELTERTLLVVKHQYFFLTGWFVCGCVVVLGLVIWWMHRLKLRRVEVAFRAVLEERARLAREMHDTLIQGCAGVSLLLEAASAEGGAGTGHVELLDYARTQLAASMDEARQAVWNLRGQESMDFGETLKRLAERLDRSSAIDIACTVEGEAYDFTSAAIHEITMASREAIYNAILHANPTQILVRANFGAEEFTLTVVDDGSGFEMDPYPAEGHYGLMGIQERIKRLGGSVDLTSAADRRTKISMRLLRKAVTSGLHRSGAAALEETTP